MKVAVDVSNDSTANWYPEEPLVGSWIESMFELLELDALFGVSLRLVGADESEALNFQYRSKQSPTNVLSFPQTEGLDDLKHFPEGGLLGDIVLCWGVIEKEALSQKKKVLHHLAHLFVHGLLHLLGFNHEEKKDAEHMESLEVSILKAVGISDPYQEVARD